MIHFSHFFFGLAVGSLVVPSVVKDFRLPSRPYHAILLALVTTGWTLASIGY